MIFFPNRTVAHPDDVREPIKKEHRKHGDEAKPYDLVDEASRESFPASDVRDLDPRLQWPSGPAGGGKCQGAGSRAQLIRSRTRRRYE